MRAKEGPWRTGLAILIGLGIIFFLGIFWLTWTAEKSNTSGERIALIRVEGVILDSKEILDELEKYEKNPSVKALLLRIDSPGGAVAPSQEIYEEVKKFREKGGKKVVTSMGSVAASGGYYIAAATDKIVANPGTLTGSIGVILELTNVEGLMEKVGVKSVVIKSGEKKDLGSPFRTMSPGEQKLLQSVLDDVHDQFIEAVAEGRGLSEEKVRPLADGRIFTGRQAKGMGLVDELGNLQDAIQLAADIVGIKGKPKVIETKKKFSLMDFFRTQWQGSIGSVGFSRGVVRLDYLLHLGA
ncbi:MAG TPA: signal peptide peptidase SppA [Nitrospiria bacterium]